MAAPTLTVISGRAYVANPASSAVSEYLAGCSAPKRYSPSALVTVLRDWLVARLVSVTVTPGRMAPVSSAILPVMVPVEAPPCANADAVAARPIAQLSPTTRHPAFFTSRASFMAFLLFPGCCFTLGYRRPLLSLATGPKDGGGARCLVAAS